jgi:hypothetical protein
MGYNFIFKFILNNTPYFFRGKLFLTFKFRVICCFLYVKNYNTPYIKRV